MKSKTTTFAALLLVTAFLLIQAIAPHAVLRRTTWTNPEAGLLGAFPINNPAPTMTSISPTSSPSGNQLIPLFLSDGTAAIKDAVHNLAATRNRHSYF